jgi:hypothetical protein
MRTRDRRRRRPRGRAAAELLCVAPRRLTSNDEDEESGVVQRGLRHRLSTSRVT